MDICAELANPQALHHLREIKARMILGIMGCDRFNPIPTARSNSYEAWNYSKSSNRQASPASSRKAN
ncbi:MAG: hypothetical protein AAGD25_40285 [Cyanobacteria bacterium P01_F01_bin.150]